MTPFESHPIARVRPYHNSTTLFTSSPTGPGISDMPHISSTSSVEISFLTPTLQNLYLISGQEVIVASLYRKKFRMLRTCILWVGLPIFVSFPLVGISPLLVLPSHFSTDSGSLGSCGEGLFLVASVGLAG